LAIEAFKKTLLKKKSPNEKMDILIRACPLSNGRPQFRHSGESRNPVFSKHCGCRIKSGMTARGVYGQTLIKKGGNMA